MSHPEQLAFFREVAMANASLCDGSRILEIGSYDVNGSVRKIFSSARTYVGVDLTSGPGVDRIGYGHEVSDPAGSFDVAISGECFEHDPHWSDTLANMARLTRPGGVVAVSCATLGRPEHGTTRTSPGASPGTQSRGLDYYRNLTQDDIAFSLDLDDLFSSYTFWTISTSFDLYFVGIRAGVTESARVGQIPASARIAAIAEMMPFAHRVIRWPLRVLMALLSDDAYQTVALRYWRVQAAMQNHPALWRFRRETDL